MPFTVKLKFTGWMAVVAPLPVNVTVMVCVPVGVTSVVADVPPEHPVKDAAANTMPTIPRASVPANVLRPRRNSSKPARSHKDAKAYVHREPGRTSVPAMLGETFV